MKHQQLNTIIEYVKQGIAVLTVNKRLSRYLHRRYDLFMKSDGRVYWPTPVIMPLSSYLENLWNESLAERPLLSHVRAKTLWERIISSDTSIAKEEAFLTHGVTELSYEAYSLIKEYRIAFPREEIYLTEEASALKRWMRAYEAEVESLGFVDRLFLPERLLKLIDEGDIHLPDAVVLAGFDELTPQISTFLKVLSKCGTKIVFWPSEPVPYGQSTEPPDVREWITIRPYEDEHEEVIQAARWIRKTIEPGIQIGIIVPELEKYREMIKREFSAELNPCSVLPYLNTKDVFNISLGLSLCDEPLIKSAMDILSVDEDKQDIHAMSSALLSPYVVGSGEAYLARARLDAEFKNDNCLNISLYEIKERAKKYPELKSFGNYLDTWLKDLKESRKRELPSYWSENFSNLLNKLGWLAPATMTSGEYQALQAWKGILQELASLDDVLGKISRSEAVSRLARIAKDTTHQMETPECPIQVLGTLEAGGIFFDHLWLLGFHEYAFPRQPSPNPFIPIYLQREFHIPNSTPERELFFSKVVLKRLLNSSPSAQVSFPKKDDERELQLSPLLRIFEGNEDTAKIEETSRLKDAVHLSPLLEHAPDETHIHFAEHELEALSGGTGIIKDQSACPFKAFALYRLNAQGIATPELGLSSAERGKILHKVLRLFWRRVSDSKGLKELMGQGRLNQFLKDIIEEVFKDIPITPPLGIRFVEIEKERLNELLKEWMNIECQRAYFKVKMIEKEKEITLGGLLIKERPDRVDQTTQGKKVIIDYKSGKADKGDWLTNRPKEPQLLIYSYADTYNAVTFASLRPGECKFVGIAREEEILPGVRSLQNDRWKENIDKNIDWDSLMNIWKKTVEDLAQQFLKGVAIVDPNENFRESPCDNCDLVLLCRVADADRDSEGDKSE